MVRKCCSVCWNLCWRCCIPNLSWWHKQHTRKVRKSECRLYSPCDEGLLVAGYLISHGLILSTSPWQPLLLLLSQHLFCPGIHIFSSSVFSFYVCFLRCTQYWLFALSFGFFGFVTGCEVGCTSPLLVKLLGLYCLTQAFAIMTALRGIAALVGPPTAGLLVDKFQDPGLALLLCGALMISATIIASIAALLNKVMERREGYVQL